MNLLYEKLPGSVKIDGQEYPVYTDFRNWIQIEILLSEKCGYDSIAKAILLCYKKLPQSVAGAVRGIADFLSMGNINRRSEPERKKPVYSFEHDGAYIYSAFRRCYGIDLSGADLHWWQFKTLFMGLEDCRFTKIMQYRAMDLSDIKNREQKNFYKKMKHIYKLPWKFDNSDITDCLENLF